MKKFFLHVGAGLVALLAFFCIVPFFFFFFIGMVAAAGSEDPTIEKGSVMRIGLNVTLDERHDENPFEGLLPSGKKSDESGLDVLLRAIAEAKDNERIAGIYLEGGLLGSDFASLQELRAALLDFKTSGKFIVSYAEQFAQGGYYIASTADTIMMNPEGMLDWHGIASQPMFYTDLFKKLGIKYQVFKVGTYKSAVEPYLLTEMSDANREQVNSFINDIWSTLVDDVAEARPTLAADSLRAYAAQYMALAKGKEYVRLGLVDTLVYADGAREWLRAHVKDSKLKFVEASDVAKLRKDAKATNDHIAVYYAYGDIVDEAASNPLLGGSTQIVGDNVVDDLDALRSDKNVKAVVLRINSGGGSAYASEQMWRAIQLLKQEKPVVVSMGGMAASGGYYMSCGADYIVADATTLTGSIGIFALVADPTELLTDKLGLHFDVVKTNEGADFGAMGRPFNAAESAAMQRYVENGYDLFTNRVAEGRGMTQEAVDNIGQGRVWTGRQALEIGLVDELGTLELAVAKATQLAEERAAADDKELKLKGTVAYPAPSSFLDDLMKEVNGDNYMERKVRAALGDYYQPLRVLSTMQGKQSLQARIPFEPNLR